MKEKIVLFLKRASLASLAFVALFVLALIGLVLAFPPEKFKGEAIAAIQKGTGAQSVNIDSLAWTLSLSDLSWGVKASNTQLKKISGIEQVTIPELTLSLQPFKIFKGSVPVKVKAINPQVETGSFLRAEGDHAKSESTPPSTSASTAAPAFMRFLRIGIEVKNLQANASSLYPGTAQKPSIIKFEESSLRGEFVARNGSFWLKVASNLNVDLEQGKLIIQGPAEVDMAGKVEIKDGVLSDLAVEKLDLDLNRTNLAGFGFIEKTQRSKLSGQGGFHATFKGLQGLHEFKVDRFTLKYDEVAVESNVLWTKGRLIKVGWRIPRTELKDFRLPFEAWRDMSIQGLLEHSGEWSLGPGTDRGAAWRVSLNNFRVPTKNLPGADDKNSSGEITLSLVSEGRMVNGIWTSPATEIQLNGNSAHFESENGLFTKSGGDKAELLFKASILDDRFEIQNFLLELHTLKLSTRMRVTGVDSLLNKNRAQLEMDIRSNRLDFSGWNSYFPMIQKQRGLQGFLEFSGVANGPFMLGPDWYKELSWKLDRLNLANLRGVFESTPEFSIRGPFGASFLLSGRGKGKVIDRASLLANVDLNKTEFSVGGKFRKSADVPFSLDLAADQSRASFLIRKGNFQFHELNLNFSGNLQQGTKRSVIALNMLRPINLAGWNQFFVQSPNVPLDGQVSWKGRLSFPPSTLNDTTLDWKRVGVEGELALMGLQGRVGNFRYPFRNVNAQVLFQGNGLTIPKLNFEIGGTRATASGEARALSASSKSMVLSKLLNHDSWDLKAQLNLNRLSPEDFAQQNNTKGPGAKRPNLTKEAQQTATASFGAQLKTALQNEFLKKSQVQIALQVSEGSFSDIQFTKLQARALWNQNAFKMQPFSLQAFGGKLSGSGILNAEPWFTRKENPQLSTSLKVTQLDINQMSKSLKPELSKLLRGKLSGELTLASNGFESNDIIKASSGRLSGQIREASFDTLEALRPSLENLITQSAAKDYLLKEARKERCIQKQFNADMDAQIKGGNVEIQKALVNFATGSSLNFSGLIDSQNQVDFKGDFIPNESCISGDSRRCLQGRSEQPTIPFLIKGAASEAKAQLDFEGIGRKLAACVAEKIKTRAEEAAKAEIQKQIESHKPAVEDMKQKVSDQAAERIKNIFKGK